MKKIALIFKLIVSPRSAWGQIFRGGIDSRIFEQDVFYPLLGIASCSVFVQMLYDTNYTLMMAIIEAIILFVSYFVGYIAASFGIGMVLPLLQDAEFRSSESRVRLLVMSSMSILVIIDIIQNLLPTQMALCDLFPIYLLFVISKSVQYFHLKADKSIYFMLVAFGCIVFLQWIIELLLEKIIL